MHYLSQAKQVSDSDAVIEFMLDREIGSRSHKPYISLAHFYEKQQRNFELTNATLLLGLGCAENGREKLEKEMAAFGQRMDERIQRDVVAKGGTILEGLRQPKKREESSFDVTFRQKKVSETTTKVVAVY